MDESERPRGFWFYVSLLFDWYGYTTERLRGKLLDPLNSFVGWCGSVLHPSLFPMEERKTEKVQLSREELNHHCLHGQRLSFFDMFSVVSAFPAHVLALHDGAEKRSEDTPESSSPQTSKYEATQSRLRGPSEKQTTAFLGKTSEVVQTCVFSNDGSRFAICYVSRKVSLWDTDRGTLVKEESLKEGSVSSVSFLGANNSILLICTEDCNLWKWEIDTNGPNLTKIFDELAEPIIGELTYSQRSDFYEDGTKLVLSTIVNIGEGPTLSVVLVDMTSCPLHFKRIHLFPVEVKIGFVISNAILSPDGEGLLLSLMDQGFEDSYCLMWPNFVKNPNTCQGLDIGTTGSWSNDSKHVVTWTMTNRLRLEDGNVNCTFIWNVEDMRKNLDNTQYSLEAQKIRNPFGDKVFWCQFTKVKDIDDETDRLIVGVIGETTRFLFIDVATEMHTHTIETRVSAKDMILWNGEAWIQSYVAQRTVRGLSPMGVTRDGSMFGAILGWPSEIIIWDAYLGVELLKVLPEELHLNQFTGGIDLMMSPSCTKFAIVGCSGVMVVCPPAPSKNKRRPKDYVEAQMVQLDNPHTSQGNLSSFKISFSGDGNSLGVLCSGWPKMKIWNLPQGTHCTIEDNVQNAERAHIQDFCLSSNGKYLVIWIGECIHIMDCEANDVAQMIGAINIDSKIASMGIKDDASELVLCMEDGSIYWYELSYEDVYQDDETSPSTSTIHELAGHRLSWMERIKSSFKRPLEDVNELLIHNNGEEVESNVEETSIHIPSRTRLVSYERHVLAEELDEASFQVSPNFKEIIRISESKGVEAWELNRKTKIKDGVSDIASLRKSSYSYSHNSSISEQVHHELLAKSSQLLNGTSIDLSGRTTLVQSSRENIIVAGNSSSQALNQRRRDVAYEFEYDPETQEDSHSVYVINLEKAEHRRKLSGRNLEPRKGLAISHDGRHVACLAGGFGSKVVVWNVYACEKLLPDYNFLSLTLAQNMSSKEGIKRDIVPLIRKLGINFFNFRHPSGMSILEEASCSFNNDMLKSILQYVLRKKVKISFLMRETSKDSTTSKPRNVIEASVNGRSPKTLYVLLKYILRRVTHEAEVAKIMTQSLVDVLKVYPTIFTRLVRDHRIWGPSHEIEVRERVFEGGNILTETSDSLLLTANEARDFWERKLSEPGFYPTRSPTRSPTIKATVTTLPFVQSCKTACQGLLHAVLIGSVHYSVFNALALKAVVSFKWRKYGQRLMVQEFAHHLALIGAYMAYCFTLCIDGTYKIESHEGSEENSNATWVSLLVCWILAVPCLYRELRQCIQYVLKDRCRGFLCWLGSAWNWMEVLSYLIIVILIPFAEFFFLREGRKSIILSSLVALESLLLWSRVLYYARAIPRIGKFVTVISSVVSAVVPFLLIALCVMFGFSIAFHVLYRHVVSTMMEEEENSEDSDLESLHRSFGTFGRTLFTVFGFTFGEFDLDQIYHAPSGSIATVLFVLYMVTVSTSLLNMLIAVMTSAFNKVRKSNRHRLVQARAMAIDDNESMMSYSGKLEIDQNIGKYLHIMTPSYGHEKLFKGPSHSSAPTMGTMNKTVRRGIRREFAILQKRSGLTPPRIVERRSTTQNTHGPDRPTMDTIQESGVSSAPLAGVRVPPLGIVEPDPYWSYSDTTDSEYSDIYSDDSD